MCLLGFLNLTSNAEIINHSAVVQLKYKWILVPKITELHWNKDRCHIVEIF